MIPEHKSKTPKSSIETISKDELAKIMQHFGPELSFAAIKDKLDKLSLKTASLERVKLEILFQAILNNNFKRVKELVESEKINLMQTDEEGCNALHIAVFAAKDRDNTLAQADSEEKNNYDIFNYIASRSPICLTVLNNQGKTPLHAVFGRGGIFSTETFEVVAKAAAPVEIKAKNHAKCKKINKTALCLLDSKGWNVLHEAAGCGYLSVVKFLVQKLGMNASALTKDGKPPVYLAGLNGRLDVVEWLIQQIKPKASVVTEIFNTILHDTVFFWGDSSAATLDYLIYKKLVDFTLQSEERTIMHAALVSRSLESSRITLMEYLLNLKPQASVKKLLNTPYKNGHYPIHLVLSMDGYTLEERLRILQLIVVKMKSFNMDINLLTANYVKASPLHFVEKDFLPMMQFLVENGAEVNLQNSFKQTAQDIAQGHGYKDIADYLANPPVKTHASAEGLDSDAKSSDPSQSEQKSLNPLEKLMDDAGSGDAIAQLKLAKLYGGILEPTDPENYRVDKDQNLAYTYFLKAAENRKNPLPEAMLWVAKCYCWGCGTKPDLKNARTWLNKINGLKQTACTPDAKFLLSFLIKCGSGDARTNDQICQQNWSGLMKLGYIPKKEAFVFEGHEGTESTFILAKQLSSAITDYMDLKQEKEFNKKEEKNFVGKIPPQAQLWWDSVIETKDDIELAQNYKQMPGSASNNFMNVALKALAKCPFIQFNTSMRDYVPKVPLRDEQAALIEKLKHTSPPPPNGSPCLDLLFKGIGYVLEGRDEQAKLSFATANNLAQTTRETDDPAILYGCRFFCKFGLGLIAFREGEKIKARNQFQTALSHYSQMQRFKLDRGLIRFAHYFAGLMDWAKTLSPTEISTNRAWQHASEASLTEDDFQGRLLARRCSI